MNGAPFYLACSIPDVLVMDPRTGLARHYHEGQLMVELQAPVTVERRCECRVAL